MADSIGKCSTAYEQNIQISSSMHFRRNAESFNCEHQWGGIGNGSDIERGKHGCWCQTGRQIRVFHKFLPDYWDFHKLTSIPRLSRRQSLKENNLVNRGKTARLVWDPSNGRDSNNFPLAVSYEKYHLVFGTIHLVNGTQILPMHRKYEKLKKSFQNVFPCLATACWLATAGRVLSRAARRIKKWLNAPTALAIHLDHS